MLIAWLLMAHISVHATTLDTLVQAFDSATFSADSGDEIAILGEALQKFIADPANSQALASPQGADLLRRQRKLINFLAIKKAFAGCEQKSNRQLSARILDAAGHEQIVNINCPEHSATVTSLDTAITNILNFNDGKSLSELQNKIFQQAIQNQAKTLLDLRYKYDSRPITAQSATDICTDSHGQNLCDNPTRLLLQKMGADYEAKLAGSPKYTSAQAAQEINKGIGDLNDTLSTFKIAGKRGWFSRWIWDRSKPDYDQETAAQLRDTYTAKYLALASQGPGLLMMTEALRNKIGGLREIDQDLKKTNGGASGKQFIFAPHQMVTAENVDAAVKEAKQTIYQQSAQLLTMEANRRFEASSNHEQSRTRDIHQLIQVNPFAVGQLLINRPEYAGMVCSAINGIDADDAKAALWNKAYVWGGAITGGVLMVSGVGSAVGAWVLAGTAAGATAATVGTLTAAAGLAVSLGDAGLQSYKAAQARAAETELEGAVLSGNGDSRSILDAKRAFSDYKKARMQAMLSLGFSALDVAGMGASLTAGIAGARLAKGAASPTARVQGVTQVLNAATTDSRVSQAFSQAIKSLGSDKVATFIGYLGQVAEKTRIAILKKLLNWTPAQFSESIKQALALAVNCAH